MTRKSNVAIILGLAEHCPFCVGGKVTGIVSNICRHNDLVKEDRSLDELAENEEINNTLPSARLAPGFVFASR